MQERRLEPLHIIMAQLTIQAGRDVQRFSHQIVLSDGVPYEESTGWCLLPPQHSESRDRRRWITLPKWIVETEFKAIEGLALGSATLAPDCRGRRRLIRQSEEMECEVDRGALLPEYDTAAFYHLKIDLSRVST